MSRRSTSPTRINCEDGYRLDCRETRDPGTWYIYWKDTDGRRRKESTGKTCPQEAQHYFKDWLAERRREQITATPGNPRWDDLLDWYETEMRAERASTSTFTTLVKIRRAVTGLRVSDTNKAFWEQYKTDRRNGKYSNYYVPRSDWLNTTIRACDSTLDREIRGVKAVLRRAIEADKMQPGFMPGFRKITLSKPNVRWLTPAELKTLLDYALHASPPEGEGELDRVALWVIIDLCTGGRAHAIETLTWEQIDWKSGWINLHRPGRLKTRKHNATVPISDTLRPVLERAERERKDNWVLPHKGRATKMGWTWPAFCTAALGFRVTRHALRHSLATKMINDGMSFGGVADFLGNTEGVVSRVYSHHDKAQRAKREFLQHWKPL